MEIEIWSSSRSDDTRAALPELGVGTTRIEVTRVQLSVLSKNLTVFLSELQSLLEIPPQSTTGYTIHEIELNLGVNGKGGIALFGKVEAGAEAGIKVKLKRRPASD